MMVSLGNLSALVFSVICCSGFSAIMPLRMPLILAFIFFISFSTVRRMKVQICRSPVFTFFFAPSSVSCFWTTIFVPENRDIKICDCILSWSSDNT